MAGDGILSLSLKKMPDDFHRIQRDVELNENQSFSGSVSMKTSNGSVIAMVILLVFFIIGSGYLLIYNVLYISISKRHPVLRFDENAGYNTGADQIAG